VIETVKGGICLEKFGPWEYIFEEHVLYWSLPVSLFLGCFEVKNLLHHRLWLL
jgi:hypothetical protein